MSQHFDCIVIGGGLGGLTAGATLSKRGKKVLLLEQHYIVGGCATVFKRKDFVMEVGLHEMDGRYEKDIKNEIFSFLEVDKNIDFLQVPELFRYVSPKVDFVHPHGNKEVLKKLVERYPEDEKGIRKLLDLMDGLLTEIAKFPAQRWKQFLIYPIMPLLLPKLAANAKKNLGDWLDANIKNEELKLILLANLVYYHDDPYTMSIVYFSAAQTSYISGGGHFIKGGSQQLSNYLRDVIQQNGGQVLMGKTADRIIVENGKAVGVRFKDSFNAKSRAVTVRADAIIGNAAIPLIKNMLPERQAKKLAKKTDHLKPACSLFSVYIGFKTEIKKLGNHHYSTFVVGENIKKLSDVKNNNQGDWKNKSFAFVDYSQIDADLAPKGKSVGVICAADYLSEWKDLKAFAYKNRKEKIARILINRLEKVIPGIKNEIEYYEVGTAKTVQRYTLNPEGTAYGYAQTPKQSGMGRVPIKSTVKNLYFAGAWTFPGGGFTGAIISGYLAANALTKKVKIKRSPGLLKDQRIVKLTGKKKIAQNTIEISLEKPKGYHYKAGQYAVLEVLEPKENGNPDIAIRSLSMVSHPGEQRLRFAMRVSESNYKQSIQKAKKGDLFRVFGPMGDFTLTTRGKGIVFLISGIGITPILPILKDLENQRYEHPVYLFYSNKEESSTAYHKRLQSVKLAEFYYKPVFTKQEDRVNVDMLKNSLKNWTNLDYYIVGTNDFIASMKRILTSNKVKLNNIKIDDFG